MALFGNTTKGKKERKDFSWIPIVNNSEDPVIVGMTQMRLTKNLVCTQWVGVSSCKPLSCLLTLRSRKKEKAGNQRWSNIPYLRI